MKTFDWRYLAVVFLLIFAAGMCLPDSVGRDVRPFVMAAVALVASFIARKIVTPPTR